MDLPDTRAVDMVCDQYESLLRTSNHLFIPTLIEQFDPSCREVLFRELLSIDLEVRLKKGESLSHEIYHDRFLDRPRLVARAFREFADS